jgi:hypothetical protein
MNDQTDFIKFIGICASIVGGLFLFDHFEGKRSNPGKKWIQKPIKNPGRVRKYLRRMYGPKRALNKDGTIKMETLDKAIQMVKDNPRRNRNHLLEALKLAKRLKEGV